MSRSKMHRYHSLTPQESFVLEAKGTEKPGSGFCLSQRGEGVYLCKRCDAPLYFSSEKFDSGCGWPSFEEEISGMVRREIDADGNRIEILCNRCDGHLGHVFLGEMLTAKNTRHCVNSISLRFVSSSDSQGLPKAIFAGGCFWGVEYFLKKIEGVLSTEVGYVGGVVVNPTYEEVCSGLTGHCEAVQISFDPKQISYRRLVDLFFSSHDPKQLNRQGLDVGPQYRSAMYPFTKRQQLTGQEVLSEVEKEIGKVYTEIAPASLFYPAEDYHQNYYLKKGILPSCSR